MVFKFIFFCSFTITNPEVRRRASTDSLTLRRGAPGTAQHGSNLWTPPPAYRGFVARALFYMWGFCFTPTLARIIPTPSPLSPLEIISRVSRFG